jgi:anti-sigma factor RsiW
LSCPSELVTGYVDGVLDAVTRAEVEAHLASCPSCRQQAAFESETRRRLRALPVPEPRHGFEEALRQAIRERRPSRLRWAVPLAAGLSVLVLWGRGAAPFVAFELALDHAKCFSRARLPAQVWGDEVARLAPWFEARGTALPPLPHSAGGLALVGGRYCPLLDRRAVHLYYVADGRHVSLFVIPGSLHGANGFARRVAGRQVRLLRVAGSQLGIVAEHHDDVAAFERALTTTVAALLEGPATAR